MWVGIVVKRGGRVSLADVQEEDGGEEREGAA